MTAEKTTSNTTWILVNTYKSKPESAGWYTEYENEIWKDFFKKFNIENNETVFDEAKGYGMLKMQPNVLFFDYVKHNAKFSSKTIGKVKKTTSDDVVIEEKLPELLKGVNNLIELIKTFKNTVRIGFVGQNPYNLFYHIINNSSLITTEHLTWTLLKKRSYGKQAICNLPSNVEIFFLENISSSRLGRNPLLPAWKSFFNM